MVGQEWDKKKMSIVVRKDNINSHEDICAFMADEQSTRDPYNNAQYRIILIPDFQKDKSCIIFKCHQCQIDVIRLS